MLQVSKSIKRGDKAGMVDLNHWVLVSSFVWSQMIEVLSVFCYCVEISNYLLANLRGKSVTIVYQGLILVIESALHAWYYFIGDVLLRGKFVTKINL